MKKLFMALTGVLCTAGILAQSPQKISYQSVIRDASNHLVTSQIGMKISILQGTVDGTSVYTEVLTPTPNQNGLISVEIGDVDPVSFAAINWAAGPYFIKTEVATAPPLTTYTITGVSPLLSVPYALHAKTVASYSETDPKIGANDINYLSKWDGSALVKSSLIDKGNIGIGINEPGEILHIKTTTPDGNIMLQVPDGDGYYIGYNGGGDYMAFSVKNGGSPYWETLNLKSGKVGIGTNNPLNLLDLNKSNDFPNSVLNISMPDIGNIPANRNAITISSAWADEGIGRMNIFSLEDDESSAIMSLRKLGYNYSTVIAPGSIFLSGESGNVISMNWEEGFSYGTSASGYNIQINPETPFYFRTYSGTWTDRARIDNQGNANFAGNLTLGGNFIGEIEIDSIHVSKITGLLGQGFTLNFPDILNNFVTFEVDGMTLNNKVVIIRGPGIETERIIGYHDPEHHNDQPGLSMEFPVIFETSGTDAQTLKNWFDTPDPTIHPCSIIIKDLAGNETSRWNLFEFKPDGYVPGNDGRTRFTLSERLLPDNVMFCEYDGAFGTDYNIIVETDKLVEIQNFGTGEYFFPGVEVDYDNRTITMTMDYNEGGNHDTWVKQFVNGLGIKTIVTIIETNLQCPPTETSRRNYFGCFPIKYEHFYGFGLNTKLKARMVISFDWWEQG